MKAEVYQLFRCCFPQFDMPENIFCKLLDADNCRFFPCYEHETLAGCAAVKDNCVRLLCVHPEYRGRDIGGRLLDKCEKFIAESGYSQAVLGGDSELFIGAVTPEEQWSDMHSRFFESKGYAACDGCIEMKMSLKDFDSGSLDIPPCPGDVSFGYIGREDSDSLYTAVNAVDPAWIKYFTFDSPVFAAKRGGRIVGFCIVDENADTIISSGSNNVGMIGCVGVVPEERRKGIGLAMAAAATRELKNDGCDDAFIHYTYLDWWYGKLGYKTFLRYWFGKKELT